MIWDVFKDIVNRIAGQGNLLIEMEYKDQVRVDGLINKPYSLHCNYNQINYLVLNILAA